MTSQKKQAIKHESRVYGEMMNGKELDAFDNTLKRFDGRTDFEVAEALLTEGRLKMGGKAYTPVHEIEPEEPKKYYGSTWDDYLGDYYYKGGFRQSGTSQQSLFNYTGASKNYSAKVETEFHNAKEVVIPEEIYKRLVKAVQELGKDGLEIGGLLKMEYKDDKMVLTDYALLPQEVGGADFEISEETMAKFMLKHMDDEDFPAWRGWWHSHHRMGLFWSGTDDAQFRSLVQGSAEHKDTFGIVFTNDGNFKARYDVRTPFGIATMDGITVTIEKSAKELNEEAIAEEMKAAVAENCRTRSYTYNKSHYKDADATEKLQNFVQNDKVWNNSQSPWEISDLEELVALKAKVFVDWTLYHECLYWGLDYDAIEEAIKKRAEKKIVKAPVTSEADEELIFEGTCQFCGEETTNPITDNYILCDDCLATSLYSDPVSWGVTDDIVVQAERMGGPDLVLHIARGLMDETIKPERLNNQELERMANELDQQEKVKEDEGLLG